MRGWYAVPTRAAQGSGDAEGSVTQNSLPSESYITGESEAQGKSTRQLRGSIRWAMRDSNPRPPARHASRMAIARCQQGDSDPHDLLVGAMFLSLDDAGYRSGRSLRCSLALATATPGLTT